MSLTITNISSLEVVSANTFEKAKSAQSDLMRQNLEKISVQEAAEMWLATLSP